MSLVFPEAVHVLFEILAASKDAELQVGLLAQLERLLSAEVQFAMMKNDLMGCIEL